MEETIFKLRDSLIPIYGKRETEAIIRLIFHHLKGWNLTEMLIHQKDELSIFIKNKVDEILQRLKRYEPIQYILGETRFHGMDLIIKPGVLRPRPETDELVDIIIDQNKNKEDLKVLDLCCGSGCIALALKRNLPFSCVTAVDFSSDAIEVAQENSRLLKAKLELRQEDIFDWMPTGKYDIIVSNPPYVMDHEALEMEKNVLDYEPHEALFVRDDNPLQYYLRISEIALACLEEGGKLYLEINPLKADDLLSLLEAKGFTNVEIIKDSFGKRRFITCELENP